MNQNNLFNQDNIISAASRISLRSALSKTTNNPFTILTIYFKNGLSIDYFVDKKDLFGLKDAISKISTSQKVDSILNEDEDVM